MANPFVRTRSLCGGQEDDHLTEFIAGALEAFEEFNTAGAQVQGSAFGLRSGPAPQRDF
jgi:hypothetical protein